MEGTILLKYLKFYGTLENLVTLIGNLIDSTSMSVRK